MDQQKQIAGRPIKAACGFEQPPASAQSSELSQPPQLPQPPQRIGILCVGNLLLRDEGLGPRIAQELLAHYAFPSNVEVLDRGVMGMALIADIRRYDLLLVVDAVDKTGQASGTVVTFEPDDIAPYEAFHGAHDTRLIDVLQALSLLGPVPETHCLGVQVLDLAPAELSIGLTPPVEAAIPHVVQSVLDFLAQQGIPIEEL